MAPSSGRSVAETVTTRNCNVTRRSEPRVPTYDYDIAMLSDFRYPGGTSVSLAEEIKAQVSAGYTTVLVPAKAPHLARRRPFNPRLVEIIQGGLATLAPPDAELRVRLLIARNPRLFVEPPVIRPRIKADVVVMVINQSPTDDLQSSAGPYYSVGSVNEVVTALFGEDVVWAPVGPLVRSPLEDADVHLNLSPSDWHHVLDVDEWAVNRSAFAGDRPVIGRHARPHWKKWPATKEELLAAYPDDPRFVVRILGGGQVPAQMLGRIPANWTVLPFGSMHPKRFLAGIDFHVYFHHAGMVEAFGLAIVEGLASGCPTIVPPHFEPLFETACLYSEPSGVRDLVLDLYEDPASYVEASDRGAAFVRERFGPDVHRRRLEELIGAGRQTEPVGRLRTATRPKVLLLADSQSPGRVERMAEVAERLHPFAEPIVVVLGDGDWPEQPGDVVWERMPRPADLAQFEHVVRVRVLELSQRYEAVALVFDGAGVPAGLVDAMAECEGVSSLEVGFSGQGEGGQLDRTVEPEVDAIVEALRAVALSRGPVKG